MKPSILEATKIQARMLIPVVKRLEQELGKEEAHRIVGEAIAQNYVAWREKLGFVEDSHPSEEHGEGGNAPAFPVEQEVVENTPDAYGHNITGCAFADWFRAIGEPEIGALMTCGVDFAAEERIRPGWEFTRTQTRMQGAPHCDFRWRRKTAG
ncbi:L-2-amino-thiazoline-4-carboxylic acid hydrolase [Minwuia thermotolerans]|uniref:2-amino-thiazoline-4-carboxylic acid hydrolase n=1 Tax=Minwuia thermotolerans TaxID=2056226 RepID=A0A2M9G781_9PROT|nr:L-2-amino-thiazoline-4-carboxylic acid hydrolase [Minwuia thermotolerans]PJK31536.1 2-amino-thiazoline-4-carboxylic acid hydrolase [Minwuia thermotolerans]